MLMIGDYGVKTYVDRDIRSLFPRLDFLKFKRLIRILSELSGTMINRASIARTLECSEPTVREYFDILEQTFIWRTVPVFENSLEKKLIKTPKGYLRDTGITHYQLGIKSLLEAENKGVIGRSFETFVAEEFFKGLHSVSELTPQMSYYRTRDGEEIDFIFQGDFGVLPIEVKSGLKIQEKNVKTMENFLNVHDGHLGLVITRSEELRLVTPRILQIPASFL
jgi:uncharacterized protein